MLQPASESFPVKARLGILRVWIWNSSKGLRVEGPIPECFGADRAPILSEDWSVHAFITEQTAKQWWKLNQGEPCWSKELTEAMPWVCPVPSGSLSSLSYACPQVSSSIFYHSVYHDGLLYHRPIINVTCTENSQPVGPNLPLSCFPGCFVKGMGRWLIKPPCLLYFVYVLPKRARLLYFD